MERNEEKMKRQSKVMSIVALAVCVVGLTIGFAAFSNTLTIKSGATVKPNESDFNVEFSVFQDVVSYGTVEPQKGNGSAIEIKEGVDTISGLSATLSKENPHTQYQFYIYNSGKYRAYLNNLEFANIVGKTTNKVCTPKSGKQNSLVDQACEDITIDVQVIKWLDEDPYEEWFRFNESVDNANLIDKNGQGIYVEPGDFNAIPVYINIEYTGEFVRADEEFTVEFGDINFLFESVD